MNLHKYRLRRHKGSLQRFLLLMCCLCTFHLSAQKPTPTLIQGCAQFACGEEIRLIAFDDMLTYHKTVAASDKIDKNGNFELSYTVVEPTLVQIAIRTSKAEFYIEPGKEYRFSVEMDPQLFDLLDPMAYGGYLQIRCENISKNDINYKINWYESVSSDIVDYFSPNILSDISPAQFDSIAKEIHARFPIVYAPDRFYESYIYYSYASLERLLLQKEKGSLYKKYLDNEYVLYTNPAYMNFLNEFYDRYFINSPHIALNDLKECINKEGHALALFNLVGKDPYLINERIREIAMIENLMQLYENKGFNRWNIIRILNEMAQTSHFEEHRRIAENAVAELQRFNSGAFLPDTRMKEANGADFTLSNFKGKWVYLQFFNTTCLDCIREMTIIRQLQEKYKNNIVFVSISTDFNFGHFIQFKEKYPQFDWTFVHFNGEYQWLDDMGITTLPDNMLIAPDGKLSNRYAPDITKELSIYLARLFKEEEDLSTPLNPNKEKSN